MPHPYLLRSASMAVVALFALPATQCSQPLSAQAPDQVALPAAAVPLSEGPPPPREAFAPAAYEIPAPRPVGYAPPPWGPDDYGYIDDGYWLSDAVFDAPPDYAFDYGGVYPWVWLTADGFTVIVEPVDDGDRYYYYRPGVDLPFFVADPTWSYGFDTNGRLAVVYDRYGAVQPARFAQGADGVAAAYLARGQALQVAARPRSARLAVSARDWAGRRDGLTSVVQRWSKGASTTPDWNAWRSQHGAQVQSAFARERFTREAEAARYDRRAGATSLASQDWSRALASRNIVRANQPQGLQRLNPFAGRQTRRAALDASGGHGRGGLFRDFGRSNTNVVAANPPRAAMSQPPRRAYFSTSRNTGSQFGPKRLAQASPVNAANHAPRNFAPARTVPTRLYARSMRHQTPRGGHTFPGAPHGTSSHGQRSFAYRSEYRAQPSGGGESFHSSTRYADGQGRPSFHMPRQSGGGSSVFHASQSFRQPSQPHDQAQQGRGGGGKGGRAGQQQGKPQDQRPRKH